MDMERPIQMLPGIGPARAARLQKLGLETADDLQLLQFFRSV